MLLYPNTRISLLAAPRISLFTPSWARSRHIYSASLTLQPSTAIPYKHSSNGLDPAQEPVTQSFIMADESESLKALEPTQKGTKKKSYVPPRLQKKKDKSPRVPPSPASGGIPDPSISYLKQSSHPPWRLPSPRRILVIIDLNGTLLYRPANKRNPFAFEPRPHASHFLRYCIDTFAVGVWSSARPQNVSKMVDKLLDPDQRARCAILWARDRFGLSSDDYDARVQCYKRLTRVWADGDVQAAHPGGGRWDQSNTVLVDDSVEKGRSEPHNFLEIPEFTGVRNEAAEVLPQVHDYLNELCWQGDISCYMRRNPFQLDPNYKLKKEDEAVDGAA